MCVWYFPHARLFSPPVGPSSSLVTRGELILVYINRCRIQACCCTNSTLCLTHDCLSLYKIWNYTVWLTYCPRKKGEENQWIVLSCSFLPILIFLIFYTDTSFQYIGYDWKSWYPYNVLKRSRIYNILWMRKNGFQNQNEPCRLWVWNRHKKILSELDV